MTVARGPALDLTSQIVRRAAAQPARVWTPVDFLDLGPRAAVGKALQRLVRAQTLTRLDRGIYYLPRANTLTGRPSVPDHNAVIDAVARRDQSRVVIDGLTAANDLGLTTAVPARITVLTDARLRPIQLGNQQIRFQTAAPSRLYWAGHPAMRIVQALHWSQDLLDSDRARIVRRLKVILDDRKQGAALRADLKQGIPTLPIWMQSIVLELLGSQPTQAHTPDSRKTSSVRGAGRRSRSPGDVLGQSLGDRGRDPAPRSGQTRIRVWRHAGDGRSRSR
jgi:hypothetical protein